MSQIYIGNRRGEFYTTNDRQAKTIVMEKDRSLKYNVDIYNQLGFDVWWIASTNVKKVLELDNFYTEEQAFDYNKLRDMYVINTYTNAARKLKVDNVSFVLDLASENKQKLFTPEKNYRGLYGDLVNKLYSLYGDSIDKEVRRMLKRRFRAVQLVNKAPLVRHIEYPSSLRGQAKQDLEQYVINAINS